MYNVPIYSMSLVHTLHGYKNEIMLKRSPTSDIVIDFEFQYMKDLSTRSEI
jgi:hypothetical protein